MQFVIIQLVCSPFSLGEQEQDLTFTAHVKSWTPAHVSVSRADFKTLLLLNKALHGHDISLNYYLHTSLAVHCAHRRSGWRVQMHYINAMVLLLLLVLPACITRLITRSLQTVGLVWSSSGSQWRNPTFTVWGGGERRLQIRRLGLCLNSGNKWPPLLPPWVESVIQELAVWMLSYQPLTQDPSGLIRIPHEWKSPRPHALQSCILKLQAGRQRQAGRERL